MQVNCPHCSRKLEFAGPPPSFCGYCGKALPQSALDETKDFQPAETPFGVGSSVETPDRVGDYRVIRTLGGGGMGVVYEAESSDGRRVALKLMRPEAENSTLAEERFRQEGRLASGIVHPRCVFVFDADQEADRPYIAMELMSGETLKDLVERNGPLPPLEAVTKILDVIDGLREAHALGVVHRDVKPSNCFLESDGRVKVGDFGLSRSVVAPSHLTQTGGFLGTVLFAAPEQHKAEAVDARTDVYSVCATLFYLLTGRAPFEDARGAAAVVARVVSEPAPSPRNVRPETPVALEQIVLRGLERSPDRRFQSLDELRAELSLLLPDRLSFAGLAARAAAYLFDSLLVHVACLLVYLTFLALLPSGAATIPERLATPLQLLTLIAYFTAMESTRGASLGKRLLRLRVTTKDGSQTPGWKSVLVRSTVFCVLLEGLADLLSEAQLLAAPDGDDTLSCIAVWIGTLLLLMTTMRPRNGYQMLHELVTGTKVVQLPWAHAAARVASGNNDPFSVEPSRDAPRELGRFAVHGTLRRQGDGCWLLGEDAALKRQVVLWLRPGTPTTDARRRLARTTRLRWLAEGEHDGLRWDAFLTPRGEPLHRVISECGRLDWSTVRSMIQHLADELDASSADGTTPSSLNLGQIWLSGNGDVQLVDWRLDDGADESTSSSDGALDLPFLHSVAVSALEGRTRPPDKREEPVDAVLPLHARSIVNRLIGVKQSKLDRLFSRKRRYESLTSLQQDLTATRNQPIRVNVSLRVLQVSLMSFGLALLLGVMLLASRIHSITYVETLERVVGLEVWQRTFSNERFRQDAFSKLQADHPLRVHPERLAAIVEREVKATQESLERARKTLYPIGRAAVFFNHRFGVVGRPQRFELEDRIEKHPTTSDPSLDVAIQERPGEYWSTRFRIRRNEVKSRDWSTDPYEERRDLRGVEPTLFATQFWLALWILWGVLIGGGVSYRLAGVALVRSNGRNAGRLQLLFRAVLFWSPIVALSSAAWWIDAHYPDRTWIAEAMNWLTLVVVAVYAVAVLRSPDRHLHDRLSGVHVVTR